LNALQSEVSRLSNLYSNAQRAVHEINRMRGEHPDLLVNEPPATVEELA
jgi:hypothetical protein